MQNFRQLRVWGEAHRLTLAIYVCTKGFPADERFGLVTQFRRAASSIGANIAEGCGRGTDADAGRCYQIALGSACEVLNHALLARDLGLLDDADFTAIEARATRVRRMLIRLIEALRAPRRSARSSPSSRPPRPPSTQSP